MAPVSGRVGAVHIPSRRPALDRPCRRSRRSGTGSSERAGSGRRAGRRQPQPRLLRHVVVHQRSPGVRRRPGTVIRAMISTGPGGPRERPRSSATTTTRLARSPISPTSRPLTWCACGATGPLSCTVGPRWPTCSSSRTAARWWARRTPIPTARCTPGPSSTPRWRKRPRWPERGTTNTAPTSARRCCAANWPAHASSIGPSASSPVSPGSHVSPTRCTSCPLGRSRRCSISTRPSSTSSAGCCVTPSPASTGCGASGCPTCSPYTRLRSTATTSRTSPSHIEISPPLRAPGLLKHLAGPEVGGGSMTNESDPDDKAAELRAV